MSKTSKMSDSEQEQIEEALDIAAAAEEALGELIPAKSRARYEKCYDNLIKWMEKNKVKSFSEETILAYIQKEYKDIAPNTKWSRFSMLKLMISNNQNINIGRYSKVIQLLKRKSVGYKPKKSNVFSQEEVIKFLLDADDLQYLVHKVALTVGLFGGLRREEITLLKASNVKDRGDCISVVIPSTKTYISRVFVISPLKVKEVNFLDIVRKYIKLRPKVPHDRFFLGYKNDKCTKQAIGVNTIGDYPKVIATFLKLTDPRSFTGHTFRRTAATFMADAGLSMLEMKRNFGWKSDSVAEGYIQDSFKNKQKVANNLFGPSTSKAIAVPQVAPQVAPQVLVTRNAIPSSSALNDNQSQVMPFLTQVVNQQVYSPASKAAINFNGNLSNCTINFNYYCQNKQLSLISLHNLNKNN